MPDFNDQFGRFMDQFQRDSRENSRSNEETANTLRELLEEQRKMREHAEEMARQRAIDDRERDIEEERARKAQRSHESNVQRGDTGRNDMLKDLLGFFKSPAILGAAIGLGLADSLTKVNLRETLFAGTLLGKGGGLRLLRGMQKISLAGPKAIGGAGKAAVGLRGAAATGGRISGIIRSIGNLVKPFSALLKPVMSVVKLFAKASLVLTPIIAIIEGAMKAFKVFQEGGSIAEVIMGFVLGALESITTGILEGLATLGGWLLSFVESIPDIFGDILDGVIDFVKILFSGGEGDTVIGKMLHKFALGFGDALLGLLGVVSKLAVNLFFMPFKLLGKLVEKIFPETGKAITDFFNDITDWFNGWIDWLTGSEFKAETQQQIRDRQDEESNKRLRELEKQRETAEGAELSKINGEIAAIKRGMERRKKANEKAKEEAAAAAAAAEAEAKNADQNLETSELNLDTSDTNLEAAMLGIDTANQNLETAGINSDTAKTNLETAKGANKDAKQTQKEILGKLKGLGDITKGLLKSYAGSIKAFQADPSAAFASISQASERGAARQFGGFDWAQKLTPFGGERDIFEKTAAAQNIGTTMMQESMAAEMASRKSARGSGTAVVNNAPNTTVVNNAKTHTQIPRGTRHTDRSLDRANRRDGLKI